MTIFDWRVHRYRGGSGWFSSTTQVYAGVIVTPTRSLALCETAMVSLMPTRTSVTLMPRRTFTAHCEDAS